MNQSNEVYSDINYFLNILKGERRKTDIQTLLLSKKRFKSVEEARKWVSDNGFSYPGVDETDNYYRVRQKDPDSFQDKSFRTIVLTDGVKAVIGRPKGRSDKSIFALYDLIRNHRMLILPIPTLQYSYTVLSNSLVYSIFMPSSQPMFSVL